MRQLFVQWVQCRIQVMHQHWMFRVRHPIIRLLLQAGSTWVIRWMAVLQKPKIIIIISSSWTVPDVLLLIWQHICDIIVSEFMRRMVQRSGIQILMNGMKQLVTAVMSIIFILKKERIIYRSMGTEERIMIKLPESILVVHPLPHLEWQIERMIIRLRMQIILRLEIKL